VDGRGGWHLVGNSAYGASFVIIQKLLSDHENEVSSKSAPLLFDQYSWFQKT